MNGCPVVDPNHFWNGEGFIVTWLINGDGKQDNEVDPCQKFTADEVPHLKANNINRKMIK